MFSCLSHTVTRPAYNFFQFIQIMSLSKPSVGQKRKRNALSLQDKLSIIEKLEKGASVSSICREYEIAKQTVSDIKKSKNDIRNFVLKFKR